MEEPLSVDVDAYLEATVQSYADGKTWWSPEVQAKVMTALKSDGQETLITTGHDIFTYWIA